MPTAAGDRMGKQERLITGREQTYININGLSISSIKKRWQHSRVFRLAALGLAIAVVATTVPLGVCLGGNGRCGRSVSAQTATPNRTQPLVNDAAKQPPVKYPEPTVQPLTQDSNSLLFQGFEWYVPKDGKHWTRLASVLPQLHEIGISALWIPPPTKAATPGSVGYDVYDLWDLGEFNTHDRTATAMGGKADLLDLAQQAHEMGIGIVVDAVLNQRSGADFMVSCAVTRLDAANRMQPINPTRMSDVWVGFNYTGRGNYYSNKTWTCDDFTAVDYDASIKSNGVFKIDGVNNDFATDVSTENGNFDYLTLLDVAYDNPAVRDDVMLWGKWITGQLGASGFRLDAAKHISRSFLKDWIASTTTALNSSFETTPFVAEYWTTSADDLLEYIKDTDSATRVFDVPLLGQFAAIGNGDASLSSLFDNNIVSALPDSAVTLVTNHDTQIGQTSDSLHVQDWFQPHAYAFVLLRSGGVPCIFYGDLFGVCNEEGQCNPGNNSVTIGKLSTARTHFAYGKQTDYKGADAASLGWVRNGDSKHVNGVAVTMSTSRSQTQPIIMNVGQSHAGETWIDILQNVATTVHIGSTGDGAFPAPIRNASVFVDEASWSNSTTSNWDFSIYK